MAWFGMIHRRASSRWRYVALFIAIGVVLEFLQQWGGVRYFELTDMAANTVGVLLGWLWCRLPSGELLYRLEQRGRSRVWFNRGGGDV